MHKKSQFQNFTFIIGLIIISLIIFFSYRSITNISNKWSEAQKIQFQDSLMSSVKESSFKSGVTIDNFDIPSDYEQICFTSTKDVCDLPKSFVDRYPLIINDLDSGHNAFLLGKKDFFFFTVERLDIASKAICIPIKSGNIKLKMQGKGNRALIESADSINAILDIPEGKTEKDMVLTPVDYSFVLNIPNGTLVDYPNGAEEQISISEYEDDPSSHISLRSVGKNYKVEPKGTTFDFMIPLTLPYEPDSVFDPYLLKIYYYNDSDWVSLNSSFDIDTAKHKITGYLDHLESSYIVARDPNIELISDMQKIDYIAKQISGNSANPFIIQGTDKYYLYLTGDNDNFPVYSSKDFIRWDRVGDSFLNDTFNTSGKKQWENHGLNPDYHYDYLKDPNVMHLGNNYIMAFTGFQIPDSETNNNYSYLKDKYSMTIWVARSKNADGPFGPANGQKMYEPVPITDSTGGFNKDSPHSEVYHPGCPNNNDPGDPQNYNPLNGPCITPMKRDGNYFTDCDESIWLTYTWEGHMADDYPNTTDQGRHIAIVKMNSSNPSQIDQEDPEYYRLTNSWDVLNDSNSGKEMPMCVYGKNKDTSNSDLVGGKKYCINEAPQIIKHNNRYYLFYSANFHNSNDYSIYYKMANSLRCLAYGKESDQNCGVKQGIAFDGTYGASDYTYGHGTIIEGPGGILYHIITARKKSDNLKSYNKIWVLQQEFNDDGTPKTLSPGINDFVLIKRERQKGECSSFDCVTTISNHLNDAHLIPGFIDCCKNLLKSCVGCYGSFSNKIIFPLRNSYGNASEAYAKWCSGNFDIDYSAGNSYSTCPLNLTVGCDVINALNPALSCPQASPSCIPKTCASLGYNCGSYSDGCGGTINCGTCPSGQICSATNHICVTNCIPKTCANLGYDCGTHSNGCSGTINCGTCSYGSCVNGHCTCTPNTCSSLGYNCGNYSDGCGGIIYCGSCSSGYTCSSGHCTCTPNTCSSLGYNCGTHSDGCGGTINCGTCSNGQTCSNGNCASTCTPKTCASLGYNCGTHSDGCGGTINCGTCSNGQTCSNGNCASTCTPNTCSSLGYNCGTHSDGCGGTINCGTCSNGQTCSGGKCCWTTASCSFHGVYCGTYPNGCGGTVNCGTCSQGESCVNGQCKITCIPKTCEQLGYECGFQDNGCGGMINCGSCPSDQICNPSNGVCCLTNNTCSIYNVKCGLWLDKCASTIDCGSCQKGYICDYGIKDCVCVPKNCSEINASCGIQDDGCGGTINCGGCPNGQSCLDKQCCFTQASCSTFGYSCGSYDDLCGGTIDCGKCSNGKTCSSGECCWTTASCSVYNVECGSYDDGCGGMVDCGTCQAGDYCDDTVGQCKSTCTLKTCSGLGYTCGTYSDGCTGTINCGTCPSGYTCTSGHCTPICTPKTCASLGYSCGIYSDGCGGIINCGSCSTGYTCSSGHCGLTCTPKTCASLGYSCGMYSDGCGGMINCGGCSITQTCTSGHCTTPCTPKTCSSLGYSCGTYSDGCGGTINCGSCSSGYTCSNGHCVSTCTPKTCASLGATCGSYSDGCGGTINCGTCSNGQTCSGGKCCWTTASCSIYDVHCGTYPNGCGGTVNCGTCSSGYSCSSYHCVPNCHPCGPCETPDARCSGNAAGSCL